jgi:hypothetical protein
VSGMMRGDFANLSERKLMECLYYGDGLPNALNSKFR